jgi:DNA-binding MarR family transcriptional regulator
MLRIGTIDMSAQATLKGCTCFRLRRATRCVTRIYDSHLQADGLTLTQYSLLSNLARCTPPSIQELADVMGMDRTSLSRTLAPLEARGMVRVDRGQDRRSKVVVLTPDGREARSTAESHWRAAQDEIQSRLGPVALAELHQQLDHAFERLGG